jgi:hypothetical protein
MNEYGLNNEVENIVFDNPHFSIKLPKGWSINPETRFIYYKVNEADNSTVSLPCIAISIINLKKPKEKQDLLFDPFPKNSSAKKGDLFLKKEFNILTKKPTAFHKIRIVEKKNANGLSTIELFDEYYLHKSGNYSGNSIMLEEYLLTD